MGTSNSSRFRVILGRELHLFPAFVGGELVESLSQVNASANKMAIAMNGVINLDKPVGLSSGQVVGRVKRLLPWGTKIGHAGTLDPFATGVLVLLIGQATRLSEWFMSQPKQYEATVKLGAITDTLDPTSPEIPAAEVAPLLREAVLAVLPRFVGQILQMPPVYSALKVRGVPAYRLARKGRVPDLEARPVRIYGIEALGYEWPFLRLRIDCGRGTYIRSVARDIGEALGVGAYLTQLRRTRVGEQRVEAASALATLDPQKSLQPFTPIVSPQGAQRPENPNLGLG